MLLTPFPEGFLPADSGIQFDTAEFAQGVRRLEITRSPPLLSAGEVSVLRDLAEWNLLFPCRQPKAGRSLYSLLAQPAAWPVAGVTMKGGGGIKEHGSSWLCYPPAPGQNFGVGTELHLALNANLDLHTVVGRSKALSSLRLSGAESEVDCQAALAAAGIGFPGLLAGRFLDRSGTPEKDLHGNETGVAFIGFDPDFQILGYHLCFLLLQDSAGIVVRPPPLGALSRPGVSIDEMISFYLKFLTRIGTVKARCALNAGVARHACHVGNFLYNAKRDLLFVSDTDSCVLLATLPAELRGPQVLRDLASDLYRCIKDITFSCFSSPFLAGLAEGRYQPFLAFLQGYFAGRASAVDIRSHADRLHGAYLNYLLIFGPELRRIHNTLADIILRGERRFTETMIKSMWLFTVFPFLLEILTVCYSLYKRSSLPSLGLGVCELSEWQFRTQMRYGLLTHLDAMEAESRAAKARLGIPQAQVSPLSLALHMYLLDVAI